MEQKIDFRYWNNNQNSHSVFCIWKKSCSALTVVKKIIVYFDNSWFQRTTKIISKKEVKDCVTVTKWGLDNSTKNNFYAKVLLYSMLKIYRMPDFLCVCVGAYFYNCTCLLERSLTCCKCIQKSSYFNYMWFSAFGLNTDRHVLPSVQLLFITECHLTNLMSLF